MEPGIYIVLAIIVLLIIIVISNIKIVPQAYVFLELFMRHGERDYT